MVDLRNIVKSFVTKNANKYSRPIKQLRSVGVQVNPSVSIDDVKLEVYELRRHGHRVHSLSNISKESRSNGNKFSL